MPTDTKVLENTTGVYKSNDKERTMNIREVANGFLLRCDINNRSSENVIGGRFVTTELVVTSLPQLLKKVKTFFEAEIDEGIPVE